MDRAAQTPADGRGAGHAGALRPILRRLEELSEGEGPAVLVAIDGRCGSGKTWLAQEIARSIPCNLFHMDEYYLPMAERSPDWARTPGGNMDLVRLCREVLEPVRAGREAVCRPYLCREGRFGPERALAPRRLNLLEGSYSHHPALGGGRWKLFLTCSKRVQLQRLRAREGERVEEFLQRWIPLEERYFQAFDIPGAAHWLLDTTEGLSS